MKMGGTVLRKKSVFFSWLLSYFIIISICLSVSSFIYFQAAHIVEEDTNRSNIALIRQVGSSIDGRLGDIQNLSYLITSNADLQNLSYIDHPLDSIGWDYERQVVNNFRSLRGAVSFAESFYVRFSAFRAIPSSDGSCSGDLLYDMYFKGTELTLDQWEGMQTKTYTGDFTPIYAKTRSETGVPQYILYQRTLLFNNPQNRVTLGVLFSEDKLIAAADDIRLTQGSAVRIIDQSNRLVSAGGAKRPTVSDIRYDDISGGSGIRYGKYGGKEMALSYMHSSVTGWVYIILTPVSVFRSKAEQLRLIAVLGFLFCLLLTSVLSVLLAWRHYDPIRQIVGYMTGKMKDRDTADPDVGDEFIQIRRFIKSTQEEKEKYLRGWEMHQAEVRSQFLRKLLQGKCNPSLSLPDILASYHIDLVSDRFGVLLYNVEDGGLPFSAEPDGAENAGERYPGSKEMERYAISNVAEEIAGRRQRSFVVDYGDMVACLVNFRTEDTETNQRELDEIARETQTFFENKLGIVVTLGVSMVHSGVENIAVAGREAEDAVEYRVVMGTGVVIRYSDIKPTRSFFSIPVEGERGLIGSICSGDAEGATRRAERIFDDNFSDGKLSGEMAHCFMLGMVKTVVQALEEAGLYDNPAFGEVYQPVARLMQCRTVSEMRTAIRMTIRNICDYVKEDREKNRNHNRSACIEQYVSEHFTDPDLNVNTVAAYFKMNPVSLSRFFREQRGETLIDFIQRCRIQKAKEIIRGGDSVQSAATAVGYGSSDTFIRNFKKYEGMTPGRYQEILHDRGWVAPSENPAPSVVPHV